MAKRIGPRMLDVVRFVANHQGCAKLPAAEYVGPNRSRQFGYRTVDRAIRAGLVQAERLANRTYRLTVAEN